MKHAMTHRTASLFHLLPEGLHSSIAGARCKHTRLLSLKLFGQEQLSVHASLTGKEKERLLAITFTGPTLILCKPVVGGVENGPNLISSWTPWLSCSFRNRRYVNVRKNYN